MQWRKVPLLEIGNGKKNNQGDRTFIVHNKIMPQIEDWQHISFGALITMAIKKFCLLKWARMKVLSTGLRFSMA